MGKRIDGIQRLGHHFEKFVFSSSDILLEVRDIAAHLYQIQHKPNSGIIDLQYTEFNFQKDPSAFQAVMVDLSKAIVKGLMELLQYIDIGLKIFLDYDKSGKNVTINLNIGQNRVLCESCFHIHSW